MRFDIVQSNIWNVPTFASNFLEDIEEWMPTYATINGLTISEDEKHVYIEAAIPGVDQNHVDVTFDKGVLWIKAAVEEETNGKKYYRKASNTFSYRIVVPSSVDWKSEPHAVYKLGMMYVTFAKTPESKPQKITVKAE